MHRRTTTRRRSATGLAALAVAVVSILPAGAALADETTDAGEPADTEEPAPAEEPATETGEVDGATVAVGLPPVPPAADEPQVAVGLPPVPPAADEPQVAVGLPPVPPAADEPQVAVGKPPVPRATRAPAPVSAPAVSFAPPAGLADTASAVLDLIDDCL